mgnify:CR=1 FL=1
MSPAASRWGGVGIPRASSFSVGLLLILASLQVASCSTHVVINEVELNPPGDDLVRRGSEFVELYIPTEDNITDWTIWKKTSGHEILLHHVWPGYPDPKGRYYVYTSALQGGVPGMGLDDGDVAIVLKDVKGNEIDRTPALSDPHDDNRSWQRYPNGQDRDSNADWSFLPSTMWNPNSKAQPTGEPPSTGKRDSKVVCTVVPSSFKLGDAVTVVGWIEPRQPSVSVFLNFTQKDFIFSSITGTDMNGSYTEALMPEKTPDSVGTWRVTASWAGSETYNGATSSAQSFEVMGAEEQKACCTLALVMGSESSGRFQRFRESFRRFRIRMALSSLTGRQFVKTFNSWYYSFSPAVASFVAEHPVVGPVIKPAVYPFVGIAYASAATYSLFSFNGGIGSVMVGLVVTALLGVVYYSPPAAATLLASKRTRNVLRIDRVRLLLIPWVISLVLIFVGEASFSLTTVMIAVGAFCITTLILSAALGAMAILWCAGRLRTALRRTRR